MHNLSDNPLRRFDARVGATGSPFLLRPDAVSSELPLINEYGDKNMFMEPTDLHWLRLGHLVELALFPGGAGGQARWNSCWPEQGS